MSRAINTMLLVRLGIVLLGLTSLLHLFEHWETAALEKCLAQCEHSHASSDSEDTSPTNHHHGCSAHEHSPAIFKPPSPISREECNVFWALAISPGFRGPTPESQVEFATAVLNEDREMCENQIPHEVPVNPVKGGWGVLVTPGDTLANTFQKTHRQWLMRCTKQAEAV